MAEISAETIRKTQNTLGKFIKKPNLTEKLLRKPPFKFLHDIIVAVSRSKSNRRRLFVPLNVLALQVIKITGFFDGLYTDTELQTENVKDRDAKILFLQKAIDVISKWAKYSNGRASFIIIALFIR